MGTVLRRNQKTPREPGDAKAQRQMFEGAQIERQMRINGGPAYYAGGGGKEILAHSGGDVLSLLREDRRGTSIQRQPRPSL